MAAEKGMGYAPRDVSAEKCGWDIESRDSETGLLRFIEVKGRIQDSTTVTVTKNEILASFNKPDQFILAIVIVPPSDTAPQTDPWQVADPMTDYGGIKPSELYYIQKPFDREPGFAEVSINFNIAELIEMGNRIEPKDTAND